MRKSRILTMVAAVATVLISEAASVADIPEFNLTDLRHRLTYFGPEIKYTGGVFKVESLLRDTDKAVLTLTNANRYANCREVDFGGMELIVTRPIPVFAFKDLKRVRLYNLKITYTPEALAAAERPVSAIAMKNCELMRFDSFIIGGTPKQGPAVLARGNKGTLYTHCEFPSAAGPALQERDCAFAPRILDCRFAACGDGTAVKVAGKGFCEIRSCTFADGKKSAIDLGETERLVEDNDFADAVRDNPEPYWGKDGNPRSAVRGRLWRPIAMNGARWQRELVRPARVETFIGKRGTALDMSRYFPQYDIDRMGRVVANARGELEFANAPGVRVRLTGINLTGFGAEDRMFEFDHAEMEEFAENCRLRGYNLIRIHMYNRQFCGGSGWPRQGTNRLDFTQCKLAERVEDLPIDWKFTEQFDWMIKCFRERGIYVMPDITGGISLWTEASFAKTNHPNFELIHNRHLQNNWRAGFEFMMLRKNQYTGKRFLDDPQCIGITFQNEYEHLFNEKGSGFRRFTPLWREYLGGGSDEEFKFAYLSEEGEHGDKARAFLRGEIRTLNAFYSSVVREFGFKGFTVLWDMFMRNLEGDARKDFNAVSVHTYHCHPGREPLKKPRWRKYTLTDLPCQHQTCHGWYDNSMNFSQSAHAVKYNNYIAQAMGVRELGKPLLVTEIAAGSGCEYGYDTPIVQAAFAAFQDWQTIEAHANSSATRLMTMINGFNDANNPRSRITEVLTDFAWRRGDVKTAPHCVSFKVPEKTIASPAYVGAIGYGWNTLHFLTRIGVSYENGNPFTADLTLEPDVFVGAKHQGMYVSYDEDAKRGESVLQENVAKLRAAGILPANNRTDPANHFFESETGEITLSVFKDGESYRNFIHIDTPRLQAISFMPKKWDSQSNAANVRLSTLALEYASIPVGLAAVSLNADEPLSRSRHLLVTLDTCYAAEHSVWSDDDWRRLQMDDGDLQLLMRAGRFRFSLAHDGTAKPKVYALYMNGVRERELPCTFADGLLTLDFDLSTFETATPFYEIVY